MSIIANRQNEGTQTLTLIAIAINTLHRGMAVWRVNSIFLFTEQYEVLGNNITSLCF